MFKSVEYVGFDADPDLRAKAERATAALTGVIRSWRDEVAVKWKPAEPDSGALLEVTLALTLPNASGAVTGGLRTRDFDSTLPGALRMPLGDIWMDLLDVLLGQMAARREASLAELVEA